MARKVEREVKKGKFASTSEYFRHLLRMKEFEEEMEKRREDFQNGKGIKLRNVKICSDNGNYISSRFQERD